MKQKARLFAAFYAIREDEDLVELREHADRIVRDVSFLERLADEGWRIICLGGEESGVVDFAAEREFESPVMAVDAAAAAGAHGRDLEWSGDGDFYTVGNAAHRQWLIEHYDPSANQEG